MSKFDRSELSVNGTKVVMLGKGQGEPLLFLHGAGTATGNDFAAPWAERFRLMMPFHPGFGESADAPQLHDTFDYVMHYADLLDELKIDRVNLVGFSMGGMLAARFASQFPERVRRLVLVAPAGMRDDAHPVADIFSLSPEELMTSLASDFEVVKRALPAEVTLDFIGDRYREASTAAKLLWEKPYDPKIAGWMHRARMPALILWGDQDKLIPVEQTKLWRQHIPHAEVRTFKGAGHLVLDERPEAVRLVADFLA